MRMNIYQRTFCEITVRMGIRRTKFQDTRVHSEYVMLRNEFDDQSPLCSDEVSHSSADKSSISWVAKIEILYKWSSERTNLRFVRSILFLVFDTVSTFTVAGSAVVVRAAATASFAFSSSARRSCSRRFADAMIRSATVSPRNIFFFLSFLTGTLSLVSTGFGLTIWNENQIGAEKR